MSDIVSAAIPPQAIDAGGRLRALDPVWVALLAEEIGRDGQIEPIRVTPRGEGYRLVDGARRLAAVQQLGLETIDARIVPPEALADDAALRLAEIKGHMLRQDLTVLDRAFAIAAWRGIYESLHGTAKKGRKPKPAQVEAEDEMSASIALIFTEAAQAALDISRRSLFLALQIATISPLVVRRIQLHAIAGRQSELLALAAQSPTRQSAIVDLLTEESAQVGTVAAAIARLEGRPEEASLAVYERMYERFKTLKPVERARFYDLNRREIEEWLATRRAKAVA